ncbi:MAG: sulfotransferase [Symploca sp. SIO2E6]|nr:sulfotransferase [Symploca sp. SIO2E6]
MAHYPNFLIIGAMKCATTLLHDQLALQSGIFMSELKEPNFFSNDEQYSKGMEWYLSHFQPVDINDYLWGESSTHYTKLPTYPQTIERIQKHLPDVKLIYVMRHPIDRLISQYAHEWTMRVISTEINQAITKHPELIDYSRYSMQLKPYFKAFGQERVLPVFFERLLSQPQAELERVCRFLGYQDTPVWQDLSATNLSNERWRSGPLRTFLVKNPLLQVIRQQLVPKSWRDWVRKSWSLQEKPELEPEKVEQLKAIFDEDLAVLGSWLDIELSCDNFKDTVKECSGEWACQVVT